MKLSRRQLLKSLAGGVAALSVAAIALPEEACGCGLCGDPGEVTVTFGPAIGGECECLNVWHLTSHFQTFEMATEDVVDESGNLLDKRILGYEHRIDKGWSANWDKEGILYAPEVKFRPGYKTERCHFVRTKSDGLVFRTTFRHVQTKLFTDSDEIMAYLNNRRQLLG